MDPYSRVPKKNTSHENEVLLQDATHLIQRPCYHRGSPCKDPAGNWTTRRNANCSGIVMSPVHQVWPKTSCKAHWKGEEDKADRGRGGKTASENGRAWSSPSPRGQWRPRKKWRKLVAKSSVVPQWPLRFRDRWWWWCRRAPTCVDAPFLAAESVRERLCPRKSKALLSRAKKYANINGDIFKKMKICFQAVHGYQWCKRVAFYLLAHTYTAGNNTNMANKCDKIRVRRKTGNNRLKSHNSLRPPQFIWSWHS